MKLGIGSGTAVVAHLTTASFAVCGSMGYRKHITSTRGHWQEEELLCKRC